MKARALILLGACSTMPLLHPPAPKTPDPVVDLACTQRVLDGTLAASLPAQAGPFRVTTSTRGAHLHRDGRALDDAEGKAMWDAFNRDVFGAGMSTASHGASPDRACDNASINSCIQIDLWVCQTSLDALGGKLAAALDHAGLGDAALSVDVTVLEHPPACRAGAACTPQPHYSTHGTYDPDRVRSSDDAGFGACANDGDCVPSGQRCTAWYLAGGVSTLEYRQYRWPTFCGCVEQRCRWFQQP